MKSRPFDVFIDGTWVNRVFDSATDPEDVRRSLINHDSYSPSITVRLGGKRIPKGRCWTEEEITLGHPVRRFTR